MTIKKYPVLFFLALLLPISYAHANHQASIEDAWIADAPPIAKIRAGYLKLHNKGNHTITIKSFGSTDFARIELHKTVVAGGMVKMEKVQKLSIKAGQNIEFKPGGYHLMLFNPKRKLVKGDQIKLWLKLEDNKMTSFSAIVRKRGEHMGSNHEHHHHH